MSDLTNLHTAFTDFLATLETNLPALHDAKKEGDKTSYLLIANQPGTDAPGKGYGVFLGNAADLIEGLEKIRDTNRAAFTRLLEAFVLVAMGNNWNGGDSGCNCELCKAKRANKAPVVHYGKGGEA